tara:strand:- start:333 stop:503 length:171 start_codon:yes stop_codon:yes gene_type:complete
MRIVETIGKQRNQHMKNWYKNKVIELTGLLTFKLAQESRQLKTKVAPYSALEEVAK